MKHGFSERNTEETSTILPIDPMQIMISVTAKVAIAVA